MASPSKLSRHWPPAPSSAHLELYMQKSGIIYHKSAVPKEVSEAIPPPLLKKGKINRIVVYRGSFNPPHVAHRDVLEHVYSHAKEFMGAVAAFILPLRNEGVMSKVRDNDSAIFLTVEQRVALWRATELRDDVYIVERLNVHTLQDAIHAAGYQFDFLQAIGADWFTVQQAPPATACDYVVSDAGRAVDFRNEKTGMLLQIPTCSQWRPVLRSTPLATPENLSERLAAFLVATYGINPDAMGDLVKRKPIDFIIARRGLQDLVNKVPIAWTCKDGKGANVWYIHRERGEAKRKETVSSSAIQAMIQAMISAEDSELGEKLEGMALGARMLMEFIPEAKKAAEEIKELY